jgi:hypothetical protein
MLRFCDFVAFWKIGSVRFGCQTEWQKTILIEHIGLLREQRE